ncbi:hypothetical protein HF521_008203 [Silurus meridionalis]|uniref:Ig-like domain-containing protein n=2 Tax=Silurus meridionalis TaxID=175797 RepID=A0A8T0AQM5_SILME|nr:hypothetical protein HF521_008203 [Silurus meridionalis]
MSDMGNGSKMADICLWGCSLEGNREVKSIIAYAGDSVLLTCSCTDLHPQPVMFTWRKYSYSNGWLLISPENQQYKGRFQLVNDRSFANLSLLISNVTVEDGGDYMCVSGTRGEYRDIRLNVKGCRLEENEDVIQITAYAGDSVRVPCTCTDLQTKPETFKYISPDRWVKLSPENEPHKGRIQLASDPFSGNTSLVISNLTEEDDGYYRCLKEGENRYFSLTVLGCRLEGKGDLQLITAYTGGSALLPCCCTNVLNNPQLYTWWKYTTNQSQWVKISPESEQYSERFQIFTNHSSGNLSLLISKLTEEDGGDYSCSLKQREYIYFRLSVKESHPFALFTMVTGIFLVFMVVVVYCITKKNAPQDTVHYNRGEGDETVSLE